MLLQEIQGIKATKSILRKFGFLLAGFTSILGGISLWKAGGLYQILFPVAGTALILSIFFPRALKYIYLPWMALATIIGWIMTRVILTIFYFGVITPFAVTAKLFGKDFLDEKIEADQKSYWVPHSEKTIEPKRLEQQF